MKQRKVSPSPIKWEALEEGISRVLDNAERLNFDAELLLKNKRYPSAEFFMLLAKEEIGKAFLLADPWASKRDISPDEYRQIFKSGEAHRRKLSAAGRAFLQTFAWQNMGDLFADQEQKTKEQSLYVDYSFSGKYWKTPIVNLDEEQNKFKAIGIDFKEMKNGFDYFDELIISDQTKRTRSAISSLRKFLMDQRKVASSAPRPEKPVIVAPLPYRPEIHVTNEFTEEELLKKYEEYIKMLTRPDITRTPSSLPSDLPSHAYHIPSAEKLRKDIDEIPSPLARKAIALYYLGLLRTNLFLEINDKAQNLGYNQRNYDDALSLMNEYAIKVAIPFNKKESKVIRMVKSTQRITSGRRGPLPYYPRTWKTKYRRWVKENKKLDHDKQLRVFLDLSSTFSMLQAMSFSNENFPRIEELSEDDFSRFKENR